MNCNKYGTLYPEKAVAPLRILVEGLIASIVGSQYGQMTQVELKDLRTALNAFEDNSFPEDEPLFLLRGQDVLAPEIVRAYAEDAAAEGAFGIGEGNPVGQVAFDGLLAHALAMDDWQPRKLPD